MPDYYRPQIQILMEILDLEVCDFVQYRPGSAWDAPILDILEVPRDREWFRNSLPVLRLFWDKVLRVRKEIADSQEILENQAAALIQCAHRVFRERVCRPEGDRLKEATRNFEVARGLFRENRAPPEEPPKKRRRKQRVVEIDLSTPGSDYAIDDTMC